MNFIFIVLLPVYQIIFLNSYAEHTRKWIDAYQMRNEEGEMESKRSLMRRIYIPEINAIVKRKGFGKPNDFEQLCYVLPFGYLLKIMMKMVY